MVEPTEPPPPPPVIVKAGGAQCTPSAAEKEAEERARYAAPTEGRHPLTQNLHGGLKVSFPDELYKKLEAVNTKLRDFLLPFEYAQLMQAELEWYRAYKSAENYGVYGRFERIENMDDSTELATYAKFARRLEKILEKPDDLKVFPRVRVPQRPVNGIFYNETAERACEQFHYADENVLCSIYAEGDEEHPDETYSAFWDARTGKLLVRTQQPGLYVYPLLMRDGSFVLTPEEQIPPTFESPSHVSCAVKPLQQHVFYTNSVKASDVVRRYKDFCTRDHCSWGSILEDQTKRAALGGLNITMRTPMEGEAGVAPNEGFQLGYTMVSDTSLLYLNAREECCCIDLTNLRFSKPEVQIPSLQAIYYDEEKEKDLRKQMISSSNAAFAEAHAAQLQQNMDLLRQAVGETLSIPFTRNLYGSGNAASLNLDKWSVNEGNATALAFHASATDHSYPDYGDIAAGGAFVTGLVHQGKTYFLTAPAGQEKVDQFYYGVHRELSGESQLISLAEVQRSKERSPRLVRWVELDLMVAEDMADGESVNLLLGGNCPDGYCGVHRVQVNLKTGLTRYVEHWDCRSSRLGLFWLEKLRLLLLPMSDNSYRVVRVAEESGSEEVGTLYITPNHGHVFVLPNGLYAGSPGCEELLNYGDGSRVVSMQALAPWRNRPAEVLAALGGDESEVAVLRETTERWLRKLGYAPDNMPQEPQLHELPVAEVELPPLHAVSKELSFNVKLHATARDISRVEVRRDGVLIPQSHIEEGEGENGSREVTVRVPLAAGQNWIEVTPVDVAGIAGESTRFRTICSTAAQPDLFVVAIGVADYDDDSLDLQYAAKDARDITAAFAQYSGLRTRSLVLTDKEVRKETVLEKIRAFLSAATVEDNVLFYIAGHGMLDEKLDYYYAPSGFDSTRVAATGISMDALLDCLESTTAHNRMLMLDTCHSGVLGEEGEEKMALAMGNLPPGVRAIQHRGMKLKKAATTASFRKRYIEEMFGAASTRRGINMLAGAAGAEFSLESAEWKNGVFTASVMETLSVADTADDNEDGCMSVGELFSAVADAVHKRSGGVQRPSFAMMENRGQAPLVYHVGHYIKKKEWSQVDDMLRRGVKLGHYAGALENSWIGQALRAHAPAATVGAMLKAGASFGFAHPEYENPQYSELLKMAHELSTPPSEGAERVAVYSSDEQYPLLEAIMPYVSDKERSNFLFYATTAEQVELAVRHGADVNCRESYSGRTPVMSNNHKGAIRALIALGADLTLRDNDGKTALDGYGERPTWVMEFGGEKMGIGQDISGLSAAQIRELGVDFAEGRKGKAVNEQLAIRLYTIAADKGDMKAQRWMGWRYRQGRGVEKDEYRATQYFRMAADQGDQAAAEAIGRTTSSSSSSGINTSGMSAAQVRELGVDYAEGRKGKPVNEQMAIQLYIKAADMGDMKAQRWMGWRYRQGRGVSKNESSARYYFQRAANQGDKAAADALKM